MSKQHTIAEWAEQHQQPRPAMMTNPVYVASTPQRTCDVVDPSGIYQVPLERASAPSVFAVPLEGDGGVDSSAVYVKSDPALFGIVNQAYDLVATVPADAACRVSYDVVDEGDSFDSDSLPVPSVTTK